LKIIDGSVVELTTRSTPEPEPLEATGSTKTDPCNDNEEEITEEQREVGS
jgi:hypothetical protein